MAENATGISVYFQALEMFQSLVNIACISEVEQEERSHCLEAKDILKEAEAELDRDSQESFEKDSAEGAAVKDTDEAGWFKMITEYAEGYWYDTSTNDMVDTSLFTITMVMDFFKLAFELGFPVEKYWMYTSRLLSLVCSAQSLSEVGGCREALFFVEFVNNFVDSDHESKIQITKELGE